MTAGGDAFGVANEREDEEHAADDGERLAADVEPLVGEVEDDAAGGDDAGLHAAEHRGDAGEVGGGQDGQARDRGEALPGDDRLAVGEKAAGEAGDERRDREADHLHRDHVDADPGGRALVGPYREHGGAERARAQPGHAERNQDQDDQAHEPEVQAGEVRSGADTDIQAEELPGSAPWPRTN